jgi:hypothetical protein
MHMGMDPTDTHAEFGVAKEGVVGEKTTSPGHIMR